MHDSLHTKRAENDQSKKTDSPAQRPIQRSATPSHLPPYIQAMGNKPLPWLDSSVLQQTSQEGEAPPRNSVSMQRKENATGLSDSLKAGVESLSGISLDDVHVHYNSSRPAEVDALAYTQGTDIHVGPGQEQHLAHEAWHVVQQKQGRVKSILRTRDRAINMDQGLEHEADVMSIEAIRVEGKSTSRKEERYTNGEQTPGKVNVYSASLPGTTSVVQCVSKDEVEQAIKAFQAPPFTSAQKAFDFFEKRYVEEMGESLSNVPLKKFTEWLETVYDRKKKEKNEKPQANKLPGPTVPAVSQVAPTVPTVSQVVPSKKASQKQTLPLTAVFGVSQSSQPVVTEEKANNPMIQQWIITRPSGATCSLDTFRGSGTGFDVTEDTVYIYAMLAVPLMGPPGSHTLYKIEVHYHPTISTTMNFLHVKTSAGSTPLNQITSDSWLIPGGKQTLKDAVTRYNNRPGLNQNSPISTHNW